MRAGILKMFSAEKYNVYKINKLEYYYCLILIFNKLNALY